MRHFRSLAIAASTALAGLLGSTPAQAYPIDCAILLCLAGGFPASAECTAAKVEFIRRITPWPIEPPLQLWRCPMGMNASLARDLGIAPPALGADGLTPEVRAYRDGIELYHVQAYSRRENNDGDVIVTDRTARGEYTADGRFRWVGASYEKGPEWLAEASGGARVAVTTCLHHDREGQCDQTRIDGYENRVFHGGVRGVGIRYRDYSGKFHAQWIRY